MRTAAKRDTPERSIITAAEALGAVVLQVSGVGLPDTLVLHEGRTYLVEVKRPDGTITDAQSKTFARMWKVGVPVYVVSTPDHMRGVLAGSLVPWAPGHWPVEGQKKREHRPGHSKARWTSEVCRNEWCSRSCLPGLYECAMCAGKGKR